MFKKLALSGLLSVLVIGSSPVSVIAQDAAPAVIAPAVPASPAVPSALMPPSADLQLNLGQRNFINEFQKNQLPGLLKDMQAAAGFDVDITIDWKSICPEAPDAQYIEFWTNQYFLPQTEALKKITGTEIGKTALKAKLKKIHFSSLKDNANKANAYSFEDGVLSYDHLPNSNLPEAGSAEYTDAVKYAVELLEKSL